MLRAPGRAGALLQYYVLVCPAAVQCNDVGLPWQAESGEPRLPSLHHSTSFELTHQPSGVRFSVDADRLIQWPSMVPDQLVFSPAGQRYFDDRLTWRAPVDPFCAPAGGAPPACRGKQARALRPAPLCTAAKEACFEMAFAAVAAGGDSAEFAVTLACGATDFGHYLDDEYGLLPFSWLPPLNTTGGGGLNISDGPPHVIRRPCAVPANMTVVVLARETDKEVQAQRVLEWLRSLIGSMVAAVLEWIVAVAFRPLFTAYQALVCPPDPATFVELVFCGR